MGLPLFEGGRLRANLRGKTADLDAAIESYNALVIDADDGQDEGSSDDADLHIDLSAFSVAVLRASEQEIAAHAGVLADLDKASGGKTVWRTISA